MNKTALEAKRIAALFKPFFKEADYNDWEKNWYTQTLSAAWIHDIGMLKVRGNHGLESAALVFGTNPHGFNFNAIAIDDRIIIGLLCLRHNDGWETAYNGMKGILASNGLSDEILDGFFPETNTPIWQLEFSGKIISTADFLRYRGRNLQNDLRQPFDIWKKCRQCGALYHGDVPSCKTIKCSSNAFVPEVVVAFDFDRRGYTPDVDTAVYRKKDNGGCEKLYSQLSNTLAYVSVREEIQLFTLGDMALFDVYLEDVESWMRKLDADNIDYSVLYDFYFLPIGASSFTSTYKTVVHVGMDSAYPEASFFTLFKYIVEYLDQNLAASDGATRMPISNNTLLHISVSRKSKFEDFFEKLREILKSEVRHKAVMLKVVTDIENKFKEWIRFKAVLPVEIIDNRLEVVDL